MALRKTVDMFSRLWLRYQYKHTTLAVAVVVAFVLLLDSALLVSTFTFFENLSYAGGFIAGALAVSFFTALPALVLLATLATQLDPLLLAFVAALGSAVGDWLILLFFEEKVFHELRPLVKKTGAMRAMRLLDRPATRWILVSTGAIIVSTPLPDEVGLGLMGVSRFNKLYIATLCFFLNGAGLLAFILAVRGIAG
ncbi:MAG: hypothetical protein ACREGJ_00565 [Candidatus Saccharimonadales bacterium]